MQWPPTSGTGNQALPVFYICTRPRLAVLILCLLIWTSPCLSFHLCCHIMTAGICGLLLGLSGPFGRNNPELLLNQDLALVIKLDMPWSPNWRRHQVLVCRDLTLLFVLVFGRSFYNNARYDFTLLLISPLLWFTHVFLIHVRKNQMRINDHWSTRPWVYVISIYF